MGRDRDDGSTSFAERLAAAQLEALAVAAREAEAREAAAREAAAARAAAAALPPLRRLDEAELMALIFVHLDDDNPRVCEGVDFERLFIFTELPASPEPDPDPSGADEAETAESTAPPDSTAPATVSVSVSKTLAVDPQAWIGANWVDDIRPIPVVVLDRPTLDAEARALLRRAGDRRLPTCNLRHMQREPALRQLEFFVTACRARGQRYCRVIPGKGVESRAQPVLKRALLSWIREPQQQAVLGWAPELDEHGEWGSAILELRAPGR